jgi:uncharacterized phage-like protein YoqJ
LDQIRTANKQLKENLERAQSELVLERKTVDLPEQKKKYVTRVLTGKSAEFILENFDYTVALFDKEDSSQRATLKSEAQTQRKRERKNVDLIVEQKEQPVQDNTASNLDSTETPEMFDTYMGELGKY